MNQKRGKTYRSFLSWLLVLTVMMSGSGFGIQVQAAEEAIQDNSVLTDSEGSATISEDDISVIDERDEEIDNDIPVTDNTDEENKNDDSVINETDEDIDDDEADDTISGNSVDADTTAVQAEDEPVVTVQSSSYTQYWQDPNYSNLIVFVDFADTTHEHGDTYYTSYCTSVDSTLNYFNGSDAKPRGMRQYLYNISYGQLRVENIMPQYDEAAASITRYVLPKNAAYYSGNKNAFVEAVASALNNSGQLESSMKLSLHSGGGVLDNLAIVVPCDNGNTTRMFNAQKTEYSGDAKINGNLIRSYNILTEGDIYYGQRGSGQIIHEFLHTVGYPDLYCDNDGVPVGKWDIMAADTYAVQYPLAYLRSAYTNWFSMDTVKESTEGVSLYAASDATDATKDRQALILKTDYSDTEFFVVEYRKQSEQYSGGVYNEGYDSKIPGSGLIIYRVNKAYQSNHDGKPQWMIYVFQPEDTWDSDKNCENARGDLTKAYLSAEAGRTSYGSSDFTKGVADGAIAYSDGRNSGIVINNVGSASGDRITFDITFTESEEETWKTAAEKTDGVETTEAASCMDTNGNLYYIMKEGGGTVSFYQCSQNSFTKLGSAPTGSSHLLTCYNGAIYTAYINSSYMPALARWNGSSWQTLYTSSVASNEKQISLTSDSQGVYLAYANQDGTSICAVAYNGVTAVSLGTQVCTSTQYASNPSVAAENGTVAVMYREAYNSNRIYVKLYDSTNQTWNTIGSQTLQANNGIITIHDQKIYLMKNGTTWGNNTAYLYVCDLSDASPEFRLMGEDAYADVSISDKDIAFVKGEPYLVYLTASSPYSVEVKYLQDNRWKSLGDTVVSGVSGGLGMYYYENDIYVTYLSSINNNVVVKKHSAGSSGGTGDNNGGESGSGSESGGGAGDNGDGTGDNGDTEDNGDGTEDNGGGSGEQQPPYGWQTIKGEGNLRHYAYVEENSGKPVTGWEIISGKKCYFDEDGYLLEGAAKVGGVWYLFGAYEENTQGLMTGYTSCKGEKYYADTKSVLRKGWQKIDGTWHYFRMDEASDYGQELDTASGGDYWYTVAGDRYYFVNNNKLAKGWRTIDRKRYYFDKQGRMSIGTCKIGSAYYHFCTDAGKEGVLGTGFFTDGGKNYYANKSGALQRGWKKIDNVWRYFDLDTGVEQTVSMSGNTWITVPSEQDGQDQIFYFVNAKSVAKGWKTIDGRRYYFDGNGVLQTGFFKVGRNTYYGRETSNPEEYPGEVQKGAQTIAGKEYYFGNNYVMFTGWKKLDGVWSYYSNGSDGGQMGQKMTLSAPVIDGRAYWYAAENGSFCLINDKTLQKGWKTINKKKYYFDTKTGILQKGNEKGLYTIGKKTYYLGQDGVLRTGLIQADEGGTYYANSGGVLLCGWQKINNQWYYFDRVTWKKDTDAKIGADYFATAADNGKHKTYYFTKGKTLAKGWKTIDGSRYYFDNSGVMQTQKVKIGRAYYYFGTDGKMRTGFIRYCDNTYYFDKKGKMVTGKRTIDGQKYVFDKDGVLQDT